MMAVDHTYNIHSISDVTILVDYDSRQMYNHSFDAASYIKILGELDSTDIEKINSKDSTPIFCLTKVQYAKFLLKWR